MSNPLEKLKQMSYQKRPLSWYRLARLLEVSQGTIKAWRTGYSKPNSENMAKIVKLEKDLGT